MGGSSVNHSWECSRTRFGWSYLGVGAAAVLLHLAPLQVRLASQRVVAWARTKATRGISARCKGPPKGAG